MNVQIYVILTQPLWSDDVRNQNLPPKLTVQYKMGVSFRNRKRQSFLRAFGFTGKHTPVPCQGHPTHKDTHAMTTMLLLHDKILR